MASLHYLFYNHDKTIDFSQENGDVVYTSFLGDSLFSFLELDLNDYEKIRNDIQNYYWDNDRSKAFRTLLSIYPSLIPIVAKISNELYESDDYPELSDNEFIQSFDLAICNFLIDKNDLIKNHNEIMDHPYIKYSDVFYTGLSGDTGGYIENDMNLSELQSAYSKAIPFCFDVDFNPSLNDLTAYERYYIFAQVHYIKRYNIETEIKYTIVHLSLNSGFVKASSYTDSLYTDSSDTDYANMKEILTPELINEIKMIKPSFWQVLNCDTPKVIAYNEFLFMLKQNLKIKKCKNCGKYFVLKGDYSTDYCDRIPLNEKFTCKRIAAINARKDKMNSNPVLKEYEKAYKRNYAKRSSKKISNEEFRIWVEESTQKRDAAALQYKEKVNIKIVQEFKKYLGNK